MGKGTLGRVLNPILLCVYALFTLYPFFWMILMSFKSDAQMFTTIYVFSPTLGNYRDIFMNSDYLNTLFNSLVVSVCAVGLSVVIGLPAAYALSRFKFRARENIAFTFLSFRFAPAMLIIIPLFVIYQRLGLYDTYTGLIWVLQLITLPFFIWILRSYLEDVSPDLEHAGAIDGYNRLQIFMKIFLPLIRPGLVAATLLIFIFAWNAFTLPLLLSNNVSQTVTVQIMQMMGGGFTVHYGVLAAGAVISALPEIALTVLIQKHLVRGLSLGAVKG
ncbi:trehalose transport system permease protein SugB [Peptococcaceae bacterium CEB3]|nr:trehalose transport system permease protein SugB [Peptococcaceae bacterium CEB3]